MRGTLLSSYIIRYSSGIPPHTQGTPVDSVKDLTPVGITPAYVGNTYFCIIAYYCVWDHPRIRREHVMSILPSFLQEGSPPHMRGTLFAHLYKSTHPGITPAYAGNTYKSGYRRGRSWDHPRIRGEHCRRGSFGSLF